MTHWATKYIGLAWRNGAQGPDAFDCWGFVRHVQSERFNRVLPAINVDADNHTTVINTFATDPERARWSEVSTPVEGDCVLFHKGKAVDHVGVWVEAGGGAILHAMRGAGVVCTKLAVAHRLGWSPISFYRLSSEP